MTIDAPAKVNLTLRLLGRRADGYHDIETVMAPISLADRIEIEAFDGLGVEMTCSDGSLPVDGSNLVCKAVEAFKKATGCEFKARIHLQKHIPHGAGLGGGSSDAAAVLKALNVLLQTHLGTGKLEEVAGSIGSDVPFFIRNAPAICRGRGEIVEPMEGLPCADLLLVKPVFGVPTAWAYGAWARSNKISQPSAQSHGGIPLINDLETPVFGKYLLLTVLKKWLREHADVDAAMMSGSGSTIFAILRNRAEGIEDALRAAFGDTLGIFRCRLLSESAA
jgi:4-diphosphocytidyl-2-C-methyl-D-erythritol kinase